MTEKRERDRDKFESDAASIDLGLNMAGGRPVVKFQIGLMAIIQVVLALLSFGITLAILRADVDTLKLDNVKVSSQTGQIMQKLVELETRVEYLTEEVRYMRDTVAGRSSRGAGRNER